MAKAMASRSAPAALSPSWAGDDVIALALQLLGEAGAQDFVAIGQKDTGRHTVAVRVGVAKISPPGTGAANLADPYLVLPS